MKPLKILVVDDEKRQRDAAIEALKGHDVTTANAFEEAEEVLKPKVDEQKAQALLSDAGFSSNSTEASGYWDAKREAEKKSLVYPDFDVVLTDTIMPNEEGFFNKKWHFGLVIGILALNLKIKKVAITSNGMTEEENHHANPLNRAMDSIHGANIDNRLYVFAGTNCPNMEEKGFPGEEEPYQIKDWATILNKVMGWEEEEKK